jgi:hypothetical protein
MEAGFDGHATRKADPHCAGIAQRRGSGQDDEGDSVCACRRIEDDLGGI